MERKTRMTEKEKVKNGMLYNPNYDPELTEERTKAKDFCYEYNQTKPSDLNKRTNIIKKLVKDIGENFLIEQPFLCDYGYNIEIGKNFYANHNLVILDSTNVKIGDNVFIAPDCSIYTAGHPIEKDIRNQGIEYAKPVTIGNDVWIGGHVTILPGVKIGNNTVIGAGSVVTKDIPDNAIAYGNPCKVVKYIET